MILLVQKGGCFMKKKILIIVIAIAIILLGIFVYFIASDIMQENKLITELDQIADLTNAENINVEEIEERLNRTITQGEYAIVETSFKNYLKDTFENVIQITDTLENPKITELLTVENYKKDGKDFIETKKYITETIKTLENCQTRYQEFFTEEKAMSYIENKGLDSYYIDFYRQELIGDINAGNDEKTVIDSIDEVISILEVSKDVINLLSENADSWQIEGESIVFNNQNVSNKYDKLVDKLP